MAVQMFGQHFVLHKLKTSLAITLLTWVIIYIKFHQIDFIPRCFYFTFNLNFVNTSIIVYQVESKVQNSWAVGERR